MCKAYRRQRRSPVRRTETRPAADPLAACLKPRNPSRILGVHRQSSLVSSHGHRRSHVRLDRRGARDHQSDSGRMFAVAQAALEAGSCHAGGRLTLLLPPRERSSSRRIRSRHARSGQLTSPIATFLSASRGGGLRVAGPRRRDEEGDGPHLELVPTVDVWRALQRPNTLCVGFAAERTWAIRRRQAAARNYP
jgi:hypothetical protein